MMIVMVGLLLAAGIFAAGFVAGVYLERWIGYREASDE